MLADVPPRVGNIVICKHKMFKEKKKHSTD